MVDASIRRLSDECIHHVFAKDCVGNGVRVLGAYASVHNVLRLHEDRDAVSAHVEAANPTHSSVLFGHSAARARVFQSGEHALRALVGTRTFRMAGGSPIDADENIRFSDCHAGVELTRSMPTLPSPCSHGLATRRGPSNPRAP